MMGKEEIAKTAATFVSAITSGVGTALDAAGQVVTELMSGSGIGALLPVVGLCVGIGLVGWGIRVVKSLTWGF